MIPIGSVEQCWGVTHALTLLPTLLLLFYSVPNPHGFIHSARLLSLSTSLSTSSILSSVHLSSTLSPWLLCFLLLPFLPNTSLKYEIIDEFHDELWHFGAEMRLMRGNYQDAELTNGLLPSFVSSWSCCTPPSVGRGVGIWEQREWAAYELLRSVPQFRMSNV